MKMDTPAESDGVVLAHPLGNQFVRHLVRTLTARGQLAEFCTCINWQPGFAARLLPRGIRTELRRRSYPELSSSRIAAHPWREYLRLVAGRARFDSLTRHETGMLSVDAICQDFDRWVARRLTGRKHARTIYAYEDAAEASFAAAEQLGWVRAYDLPIAYWETGHKLLAEEAERWPQWEFTLESTRNSPAKLERKSRELALANIVICPSRFVAESLPPQAREKKQVLVAPFGSPAPRAESTPPRRADRLRVLFVGAMTQRKGLADLFTAMQLLKRNDVELIVLGSPLLELEFYRREYAGFLHEKPRSHAEVLAMMATCDVFCLPSIVEGRALVIQEALSAGLPAIVTPNTGADDAIEEGRNGFVVPIRSPEAIAAKIAWFADHRPLLPDMSRAAQASAARFTWVAYGEKIATALRPPLNFPG